MRNGSLPSYDVAVIGAGPVGSVAALAQARKGARVVLFEANPKGSQRLAGEWLHPPAMDVLQELGVDLAERVERYPTGEGFVVFPEDGSAPIPLPYTDGSKGFSCEHSVLVDALREAAASNGRIDYLPDTWISEVEDGRLTAVARAGGGPFVVEAPLIIGADGRNSLVRAALDLPMRHEPSSRMVGVVLHVDSFPFEGFGHVFLCASGPILAYPIGPDRARLIADLPSNGSHRQERTASLWEAYGPALPEPLRSAFHASLVAGNLQFAANAVCSRSDYGNGGLALAGDSVGHYHPMTALGITLGFADALVLATSRHTRAYERRRLSDCRVPELIAIGMYEAFARHDNAALAIRDAIFDLWRRNHRERERTMRYLACQDGRLGPFAVSFSRVVGSGLATLARTAVARGHWRESRRAIAEVVRCSAVWVRTAFLHRRFPSLESPVGQTAAGTGDGERRQAVARGNPPRALKRGVEALISLQAPDGSWEGEVVWCPMLAAQYVLTCHITGSRMPEGRREKLLRQFERTQLAGGLWGQHAHAEPSLFVTTLVYVAARLLGVEPSDPLLILAAAFVEGEGVVTITSWGKFWLALVGLYEWRGVHPILPEAWALPRWLPLHPSRFYCHTRMIYMGMAAIYGRKYRAPATPVIEALRTELYPEGYDAVDFAAARWRLRPGDLYRGPSAALRGVYRLSALVERLHGRKKRRALIAQFEERIRWELRTTDHTSISPVSGLLNIIALWLADPEDPDLGRALEALEGWLWEDDEDGTRVAGARSASWDTAFALQALTAASSHAAVGDSAGRGARFLATQQIRRTFDDYRTADRVDPKGGWCFAGVWHGWPVSDCTAEAVSALVGAPNADVDGDVLADAVRFILQCRNRDGGFGSYEPRRSRVALEWMNPAEMFGGSMTEASYVECTASCVAALSDVRASHPRLIGPEANRAIAGAVRWLRSRQRVDGAWSGAWGVHLIYGTMFGVKGLLASGAPAVDPAVRRACRWLKARQRPDGGWGEHFTSCLADDYVDHPDGQVIQTAWALTTLLEADDPDWRAIDRGARYLARMQNADGSWPKQDMAGVFFRTALLDYVLYRSYFPVWALALYETRRKARLPFAAPAKPEPAVAAVSVE